ncbi:3-methyl-2-oxobutanoate hydroxymethyltransferase [Candidatus Hydrogenisulfobacillus filiaventi]|uniref:3-methyl-2-oxobutanoate hydroxymethyltransferase n=1 Tax=Candidatus Hydrogenisulfobacillus filiaventi TaxID=2707344 RepID=A0A6F8ZED0_9FIRM|nr:3-methyl-2-oxobutanoate hydroxymethyltransferase [Bacillota bacterium]CAB1128281.1 3-methyl-2-oxobutanoate hydroxymethyltransferase [Candidatus Hydrogenisulfobacillus filiaventi]
MSRTVLTAPAVAALKGQRRQVWVTAYDVSQARLAEGAGVDVILVGDSLGMTTLGFASTLPVTLDMMVHHARAVRRGAPATFLAVDLPFLTYPDPAAALAAAGRLLQEAGADAVKLEGGRRVAPVVERLVAEGIPVVGHIGLTPQQVQVMGGYKVQGRAAEAALGLVEDARALEAAGIFALVLEGIPDRVAGFITRQVGIPTIGIGAGAAVDGQVLVWHDLLGLSERQPKFVRAYARLAPLITDALTRYREDVLAGSFPADAESYHLPDAEWDRFLALWQAAAHE